MERKYLEIMALNILITLGGQYQTEGRIKEPEVQPVIQAQGVAVDDGGENRIFLSANLTVVETHRGSDVTLNCRVVRNTDYGTISWFKKSQDNTLLLVSVGDEIYINDDRFSIIRPVLSMNWSLQIRSAQLSDGGDYICQTSHHPPSSVVSRLKVYQATASIVGSKEKVFRAGTDVTLVCLIKDITHPPVYIFWYHNDRMINYDSAGGVSVAVSSLTNLSIKSVLTLRRISQSQAGRYRCELSSARSPTARVTVKHSEHVSPEPVVNSASANQLQLVLLFLLFKSYVIITVSYRE